MPLRVGTGTKSGFCPANQLFGDWRKFDQSAPDAAIGSGDAGAGNCQSFSDGVLGLSPGWGDVYRWQRPGQFVDMGTHGDGTYVVRITVNPKGNVLEVSRANDSAYALVHIVKDSVGILERGQGLSPWDKHKKVFTDQS